MSNTIEMLESLKSLVNACTRCPFDPMKDNRASNGSGRDTRVMFVADAPESLAPGGASMGSHEEQLCVQARQKANLENSYCTYMVKCRFGSEVPTAVTFAKCIDFLRREIQLLRPQVIVTIGKTVRVDDNGKVHSLDFAALIREFIDSGITVTWTHDPHYIYAQRKKKPALVEEFYKQYTDISARLH